MKKMLPYVFWSCRILAAVIMLQTLYFKFTASEESVYIFTTIHMEPWGRIGIGIMELVASILLFVPRLIWAGALLGIKLMAGAIFFHIAFLGISVMGDGGYLFFLALTVLACCSIVAWIQKDDILQAYAIAKAVVMPQKNV